MRILLFTTVFLFNYIFSFCQNITGNWKGNIQVSGQHIPIIFHFYQDSLGRWDGTWDSPLQKAMNLSYSGVTVNSDSLIIDLKLISGYYSGKFINEDSISGIWHQSQMQIPLNISRTYEKFKEGSTILNPNEKEIAIDVNREIRLFGTLLSKNSRQKLAIIIPGSGPTDRNGNSSLGITSNSYKMLAEELDQQNIATFRYDKRGVGKSVINNMNETDLVFDNDIEDVKKIFKYLKDTLGYQNIYFLGHSEGSLIGMIAAQHTTAKGFISVSGASSRIDKIIIEQLSKNPKLSMMKNNAASIFSTLKKGEKVNVIPKNLQWLFKSSTQPYIISWLKYSPTLEIKKLKCPVLILQGTCDLQIKKIEAEKLHKANKNSILDIIPLMTHTLKNADARCKDKDHKTYTEASLPLNKKFVTDVVDFIKNIR